MNQQLLFLELNEVNFDYVRDYCKQGLLPNLAQLIASHGIAETHSETRYENLEPWIQWVTAHTGKTFGEHAVYRLGDIVNHEIPQIWEQLEERGVSVGAISPMNAKHRLRKPAFFVPDPWTPTGTSGSGLLKRMSAAISQVVNDNAQSRVTPASLMWLLLGVLSRARVRNYATYVRYALTSRTRPWRKSMFLDLLLADVFLHEAKRTQPQFATLFLNSAAHIQHHYLFNSKCYEGTIRNPDWYVLKGADPVLEVFKLYDSIVGQVRAEFPKARIMIATGLHQDPHEEVTFYWRLKDHAAFLRKIGAQFTRVEARMSRDFIIFCDSPEAAKKTAARLSSALAADGTALFEVDNRGQDVFVMLTYPREIKADTAFTVQGEHYAELATDVAFVALKNGQHNGTGYFIDSGLRQASQSNAFPLTEIPQRIFAAFALAQNSVNESSLLS